MTNAAPPGSTATSPTTNALPRRRPVLPLIVLGVLAIAAFVGAAVGDAAPNGSALSRLSEPQPDVTLSSPTASPSPTPLPLPPAAAVTTAATDTLIRVVEGFDNYTGFGGTFTVSPPARTDRNARTLLSVQVLGVQPQGPVTMSFDCQRLAAPSKDDRDELTPGPWLVLSGGEYQEDPRRFEPSRWWWAERDDKVWLLMPAPCAMADAAKTPVSTQWPALTTETVWQADPTAIPTVEFGLPTDIDRRQMLGLLWVDDAGRALVSGIGPAA